MLQSLRRAFPRNPFRRAWKPLDSSNSNFGRISANYLVEEETIPDYAASRYYPTQIGEVIRDRYQIIGELGYGATSTAWLARDMNRRPYVTLKIFIKAASMGQYLDDELKMYQRIARYSRHPGSKAVRSLIDSFHIDGPEDKHHCLVHPPLFESVREFLLRNPVERLPNLILAVTLRQVFLALDYLHTEYIKANNMMFELEDDAVFVKFEQEELKEPSPRKEPNIYRAPEDILQVPWSYSIDIWNVGCMIWNIFEGGSLFTGKDAEFQAYRGRAHLAEMINLLGPPQADLLARAKQREKFFTDSGDFRHPSLLQGLTPLEERETTLEGEDKESFLRMMRRMLQWEPEKRSSAKELAEDEWIRSRLACK
ncbi:kinase-like domain-containing protein [Aspergillus carlsbadensis]|nr:kinase-like domain-containing protein [Aspergillus carlsbadensis]